MSHQIHTVEPFALLAKVRIYIRPEIFEYYELRSQGLIQERSYDEWQLEALQDAERDRHIARQKVRVEFRQVEWDRGFWSEESREACGCEGCEPVQIADRLADEA